MTTAKGTKDRVFVWWCTLHRGVASDSKELIRDGLKPEWKSGRDTTWSRCQATEECRAYSTIAAVALPEDPKDW